MAFSKTLVYRNHICASKPSCAVLHKNRFVHKHRVLHKNNVLAGPVQALFAACRIALSVVAGGTRRRRLNTSFKSGKAQRCSAANKAQLPKQLN